MFNSFDDETYDLRPETTEFKCQARTEPYGRVCGKPGIHHFYHAGFHAHICDEHVNHEKVAELLERQAREGNR